MDDLQILAIVEGILQLDAAHKQEIGRRFAARLGLTPGSPGPDKGIDGSGITQGKSIYFQSKLFNKSLDASKVADFWGNTVGYKADISLMLAGRGYTEGFKDRLSKFQRDSAIKVHLLSLEDIFAKTDVFQDATTDLPPLRDLSNNQWYKAL